MIENKTGHILVQQEGYEGPDIWHKLDTVPMSVDPRADLSPEDVRQVGQIVSEMGKYTEQELRYMIDLGRRAEIMLRYREGQSITGNHVDELFIRR